MPEKTKPALVPPFTFALEETLTGARGHVFEKDIAEPIAELPMPKHGVKSLACENLLKKLREKFPGKSFWIDGVTLHRLTKRYSQREKDLKRLFVWNEEEAEAASDLNTEEILRNTEQILGYRRTRGAKTAKRGQKPQSTRPKVEIELDAPGLKFAEDVGKNPAPAPAIKKAR